MKTSLTFEQARKAALNEVEAALAKQTALCHRQICTRLQVKLHITQVKQKDSEVAYNASEVVLSAQVKLCFA